jgi:hypothetical protein
MNTYDSKTQDYDIEIFRGESRILTLKVWNNDGSAFTLTGYTAKLIGKVNEASAALFTLTSSPAAGIVISSNVITITFTPAVTALFDFLRCRYDLMLSNAGGTVVKYPIKGNIIVTQRMTS